MSTAQIELDNGIVAFKPGDTVTGIAMWQLDNRPKDLEINLFWYTTGKGTRDIETVDSLHFDNPKTSDAQNFEFQVPVGPYSFSGTYISVNWAIELVTKGTTGRIDITVSSTGDKVQL